MIGLVLQWKHTLIDTKTTHKYTLQNPGSEPPAQCIAVYSYEYTTANYHESIPFAIQPNSFTYRCITMIVQTFLPRVNCESNKQETVHNTRHWGGLDHRTGPQHCCLINVPVFELWTFIGSVKMCVLCKVSSCGALFFKKSLCDVLKRNCLFLCNTWRIIKSYM